MTPQLRPESPLTTAARVATATTCKSGDGSLLRSIPCAEPGSTLGSVGLAHIPSSERAATAARSEEVLLTDSASVACPARPAFFFRQTPSMDAKILSREEAGELPSSTCSGVQASAPTGGSLGCHADTDMATADPDTQSPYPRLRTCHPSPFSSANFPATLPPPRLP